MEFNSSVLDECDSRLFDLVIDRITSAGCSVEFDREARKIFFNVTCSAGTVELAIAVSAGGTHVEFSIEPGGFVPLERMSAVAEFCLRGNQRLHGTGRLDLDYDLRKISAYSCERFTGGDIDAVLVRGISTVNQIIDAYYLALRSVMQGRSEPYDALQCVFGV